MQFPLPKRQFYLPKTILIFKQTEPPTDERAKLYLRRAAQKAAHDIYFMHIMTELPFANIDTLGRYLFGVPGFKGHITVIPYSTTIHVELPLAPEMGLEEAVELVKKAASKLGWTLLAVKQNSHVKEVPIMRQIVELLNELLAKTPLRVSELNFEFADEDTLALVAEAIKKLESGDFSVLSTTPHIHDLIAEAVERVATSLPLRGRYAFGEWLAGMVTGWSTRFNNESDVIKCESRFGEAAFNDPSSTTRVYLCPNRDTFSEFLPAIQQGVAGVYQFCMTLE